MNICQSAINWKPINYNSITILRLHLTLLCSPIHANIRINTNEIRNTIPITPRVKKKKKTNSHILPKSYTAHVPIHILTSIFV